MLGKNRGKQLREYVPDYVVFDLETTGTSPNTEEIIEISGIRVKNGNATETFSSLVNPMKPISPSATAVNGITDDMVLNEPVLDEVLPGFLDFIQDSILVGHNIACFDMKFIWKACEERYGMTLTNDYLDTLPFSRRKLPELSRHRLVDIAAHYEIDTSGAHRALEDCIMNQLSFEYMSREQDKKSLKKCPKCAGMLKLKKGVYGEFWGCSSFPACRYTENK